jgi:hypothetical protein
MEIRKCCACPRASYLKKVTCSDKILLVLFFINIWYLQTQLLVHECQGGLFLQILPLLISDRGVCTQLKYVELKILLALFSHILCLFPLELCVYLPSLLILCRILPYRIFFIINKYLSIVATETRFVCSRMLGTMCMVVFVYDWQKNITFGTPIKNRYTVPIIA